MYTYNRILLARDFSPSSGLALQQAVDIARHYDAELHILFADVLHADPYSFGASMEPARSTEEMKERLQGHTEETFSKNHVDTSGLSIKYVVERDVAPGPAILNYADHIDVDLIVMGTHGRRGLRRVLLGSVAEEVVRLSSVPVYTVPTKTDAQFPFRSMLLPVDFSEHARDTVRRAKEMASEFDTRLTLLHVIEDTLPPSYHTGNIFSDRNVDENTVRKARERLASFYTEAGGPEGIETEFIAEGGHSADRIIHFASTQDVDVVMMASHGRTGMARFAMGSVADKVIRNVRCPVLTLKVYPKAAGKMREEQMEDVQS